MSSKTNLSRRHLLSIGGAAAGLLASRKALAAESAETKQATTPAAKPAARSNEQQQQPAPANHVRNERPKGPVMRDIKFPKASPEALSVLGGLAVGSVVGQWTIADVYDFHLGAVPVVLQDASGAKFQVDVLRRAPGVAGIAETRHFSLFLSNRGNGATRTNESHGLGAMALAAAVGDTVAPDALLSLAERATRFPGAGYSVSV